MAEDLIVDQSQPKAGRYQALLTQCEGLLEGESDQVAGMANLAAALKQGFGFFWVGFYRVVGEELILGPFQGEVACTRIAKGKGVCGTSWSSAATIIVPDVDAFPGHIACSSASKSEIVVPVFNGENVVAVLDVDSDQHNDFDTIDQEWLEKFAALIAPLY